MEASSSPSSLRASGNFSGSECSDLRPQDLERTSNEAKNDLLRTSPAHGADMGNGLEAVVVCTGEIEPDHYDSIVATHEKYISGLPNKSPSKNESSPIVNCKRLYSGNKKGKEWDIWLKDESSSSPIWKTGTAGLGTTWNSTGTRSPRARDSSKKITPSIFEKPSSPSSMSIKTMNQTMNELKRDVTTNEKLTCTIDRQFDANSPLHPVHFGSTPPSGAQKSLNNIAKLEAFKQKIANGEVQKEDIGAFLESP